MNLSFFKYHGTGNDFILVDDRSKVFDLDSHQISELCHRHTGVGADGLILLREHESLDFEMVYFNADGQEGSFCGNGGRCCVVLAGMLIPGKKAFSFMASDVVHQAQITEGDEKKAVVRLSLNEVPSYDEKLEGIVMDTGSPHYVRFVEQNQLPDVFEEGRKLRYHKDFEPNGVNANFVSILDGDHIDVRTYERGVENETLSCGTGVTASALAYAIKTGEQQGKLSVHTRGGSLKVEYKRKGDLFYDIWLEGPAMMVFKGHI